MPLPLTPRPTRKFHPGRWAGLCLLALLATGNVHADEIRIGGTGSALATMQALGTAFSQRQPQHKVTVLPSLGSGGGIKAVMSGALDLAVSSRALKDDETKAGAVQTEYARTPFVFAVAATNPVSGLSTQSLIQIFAGKTEAWPDGKKIRLVLRPVGDSDSELVKSISPEMREAKILAEQRRGLPFAVTDQDAADSIEKIDGALGTSTLAQILSEKRALKALKWNQVEPSAANLAKGSYPLFKQLWFVNTAKMPAAARDFMAFVQSPAGREILQRSGHWVK